MADIQEQINQELQQAREICDTEGKDSGNCAAAWDAVEELQAEASHRKEKTSGQTSLERYCNENPEADECRIYED